MKSNPSNPARPPTPAAQQRQLRKQWARKHRACEAILSSVHPAAAVLLAIPGEIPDFLQSPFTVRGARRLALEQNALLNCYQAESNPLADTAGDGSGWQPDLPFPLRASPRKHVQELEKDSPPHAILRLPNRHTINPDELAGCHIQGRMRAVYYFDTHLDARRPAGEWAIVYRQELQAALPSVCLDWKFGRASYWINIVRTSEDKIVSELHVHSRKFLPLFRMSLLLPDPHPPLDAQTKIWWRWNG